MRLLLFLISITLLSTSFLRAQELSSPESIVWDHVSERYLVSNAGDGLLRAVDQNQESSVYGLEAKASHGLLIRGDRLYACYRTSVRAYDLHTEALVDVYSIPSSKFLNGICADDQGNIYVTDFSTKAIFRVKLDAEGDMRSASTWKRLDRIPNGIAYDPIKEELDVLTWGSDAEIFCIDRETARITMRESIGYDNLEAILITDNGIYVSAWSPAAILHFPQSITEGAEEMQVEELEKPTGLALTTDGILVHLRTGSTGIEGLSKTAMNDGVGALKMAAFPNPVSVNSLISYQIQESGDVSISIYDCRGNRVEDLGSKYMEAGHHQFFYDRGRHGSGLYFIHIRTEKESQAIGLTLID